MYNKAKEIYASHGVDTEQVLNKLAEVAISIHCWQGDDVGGFEKDDAQLSGGGIQTTGNYKGKARTIDELKADIDKAFSLIPGKKRLNVHACYADLQGKKIDRDKYTVEQFQTWIDFCKERNVGMDFNPSFFSHPLADDGLTLSSADEKVRKFWVDHAIASRKIAAEAGKQLDNPVVTNYWIPDGYKDIPADRISPRKRLEKSLDEIFAVDIDEKYNKDAVECKLFGIGSESYVVGSHEFYMGYAVKNQKLLCLDAGHFHPTETIADKISSVLQFVPEVLLHVSRGVRWDSDHVVILDDQTKAIMQEISRGNFFDKVHIGLDFFDASINRIAAWVIGSRSAFKAMLLALLEPVDAFVKAENAGDNALRLALMEDSKALPFGAVWEEFCKRNNVLGDFQWQKEVAKYEEEVLSKR